ncbi:Beta-glucosidase [Catenovulum agarivorans DS-2]|uniref:Beta-glucosidase n=1 Tax=Catenovulum agarivorans DS-2 TaxID=1328313 RepID=W7Q7R2_9ALTE|nr:glycoside hydrolase family 3 C-terminal domain-containing protein [Catenovulum agarivorans]EWH08834.1 Beta-glucosidase [Catenovulum agarivorans DS-2]
MTKISQALLFACAATAVVAGCTLTENTQPQTKQLPFQNQSLSFAQRTQDLISRLTLEEKVSQMFDKSPAIPRLGIAEYNWWNEALHGVARAGSATVYPQAIGLAATFDEALIYKVASAISEEGRAKHHAFLADGNRSMYTGLTYWSPNINIFRDPRWGRGQETYGEDPYLTTRIAVNFVNGLQGDDDTYLKSVATLKHYAVHSGPEISRHSDNYNATAKDLAETYLLAFKDTIAQTNVSSIMCAYNSVNGTPACGNYELIQNKLRDEFNFNGYMVSDCGAIADFYDPKSHHIVDTEAKAAAMAVKTGTDLNCGDHHGNTFSYLIEAVKQGLIDEKTIDNALYRLFYARFKLGMFDSSDQVAYAQIPTSVVGSEYHLALATEAAEKSMVLLKNNGILPLNKNAKIALIGPNADNQSILVGNYHGTPIQPITPKAAFENRLADAQFSYHVGTSLIDEIYTHYQTVPASEFVSLDYKGQEQAGLITEYFANPHFGNQPVKRQLDTQINYHWKNSPINGKPEQEFSVRWRGFIKPTKTAEYQFSAKNISFTINGKPVNSAIKLVQGQKYQFNAESKLHSYWHSNVIEPMVNLSWIDVGQDLEQQALTAAAKADVVIFVGGITANLEGEEMPLELDGFSRGDRTHLKLPASQQVLLKKLKQLGKPVILVNMSGSAMALNWEDEYLDAVIQGFYPGEATGSALTNIIYGDTSPSGKLPVTFYKSVADLPDFKDYSMQNRTYKYFKGEVLYPFGYGLSYADFSYEINKHHFDNKGNLHLVVDVTNQSAIDADEVTQVYLSMPNAPVETPIRQLVKFERNNISANSTKTLNLVVNKDQLTYVDNNGDKQKYKGKLMVSVGSGQGIKIPSQQISKIVVAIGKSK